VSTAARGAVPVIEFRIADQNAVYRGVSLDRLMEGAGEAVARFVLKRLPQGHPHVLVLAGKGNNGGDGLAAALHLARAGRVTVVLAEARGAVNPLSPAGRALKAVDGHRAIVKIEWGPAVKKQVVDEIRRADIVLDCLLGSGISGPVRPPYDALVAISAAAKGKLVSVDVPSGFPFAPAVQPDVTLTIERPKVGMTRANSGRIVPIHIGFPPEAWTHTGPGELLLVPPVGDEAQKRDRGVLGVVAGGPYSGAPALVALAAHACGVGLVHIFTPESVADVVRRFDPTLIVHALAGQSLDVAHVKTVSRLLAERRCSALAIGPGLGRVPATLAASAGIIRASGLPIIVDADAIAAAAAIKGNALRRAVITPHAGEFEAFAGRPAPPEAQMEARARAAKGAARSHRTAVLLKGHVSVVTDGTRTKLNDTGVSAMAVGGSGDVLTGIIGAMLSKGLSPFDAARVGAFVSGKAGELAYGELGHSLKPTDMIAHIPRVMARYLSWWGGRA
jgi:ADP-dependent NAD(P)H-hydrate dehydratase / NAD(P)H-hydrate epimerase